jgi:hypothetical protein
MRAKNKADELPKIYAHLQPGKVTSYETKVKSLTPGTATWILRNRSFTEWTDGKIPVLFISGGPGTGKSHLSTKVIDYLRKTPIAASRRQNRVGYYYFKDDDKSTQSVLTALCAIVYQVATEDEIYRMHATEVCDRSPSYVMATCGTVWYDFLAAEHGPTSDNRLFLVLDGIDEADRDGFTEFLKLLSASVLEGLRIQILLVGRPEMNAVMKQRFAKSPFETIEISSKVNSEDVRKFSEARYDECIKVPKTFKGLRQKVVGTLTDRANGMFLWVDLIYKEELQDILSPMKLKEALGKLPEGGLTDLYDRIFLRVERDNGPAKRSALRELFCWTAYFKKRLSLFYLNELVHFSIGNQFSDAEVIIEESCASLFVLVKTGGVLLDELNRSETERRSADCADEGAGQKEQGENAEAESQDDSDDEGNYDDDKEMAAMAVAEEQHRNRQREIFVHLRHASLGDYLRRADLKPTTILSGAQHGEVHVLLTILRIICNGADAPQELWLYLMSNFLDQLRSLDNSVVSDADTKFIVEYLHDIFTSETLGRHIAKFHKTPAGYPLLGDSFYFGSNTDLQSGNRLAIQQWLRRAQDMVSAKLNSEVSNWTGQILGDPVKLLVPLTKVCISEWLACKGEGFELYWRFRFIWHCIVSVSSYSACLIESPSGEKLNMRAKLTNIYRPTLSLRFRLGIQKNF